MYHWCHSSLHQLWLNFTEKKLSDAASDLSLSIDKKSTIFSEVLLPPCPVRHDHIFPQDQPKKEMKELQLDLELRVHEYVDIRTFFAPQDKEQKKPLSTVGVIRLVCEDYQFLVKLFLCFYLLCFLFVEA